MNITKNIIWEKVEPGNFSNPLIILANKHLTCWKKFFCKNVCRWIYIWI